MITYLVSFSIFCLVITGIVTLLMISNLHERVKRLEDDYLERLRTKAER